MVLEAEILERRTFGRRTIGLSRPDGGDVDAAVDAIGEVPLPPYIKRAPDAADRERYQTVYARARGSVAAPTAGLHLSEATLARLDARAIERTRHHAARGLRHVSADPDRGGRRATASIQSPTRSAARGPCASPLHSNAAPAHRRGRHDDDANAGGVAAVNAAVCRAGAGYADCSSTPAFGSASWAALLTNFHLPQSSLLMLVCAFGGRELVLEAYRRAVRTGTGSTVMATRCWSSVADAGRLGLALPARSHYFLYPPPSMADEKHPDYEEFDLSDVRTYPLSSRASKVRAEDFARPFTRERRRGTDRVAAGDACGGGLPGCRRARLRLRGARARAILWGLRRARDQDWSRARVDRSDGARVRLGARHQRCGHHP